jgi:hypothetical protein
MLSQAINKLLKAEAEAEEEEAQEDGIQLGALVDSVQVLTNQSVVTMSIHDRNLLAGKRTYIFASSTTIS